MRQPVYTGITRITGIFQYYIIVRMADDICRTAVLACLRRNETARHAHAAVCKIIGARGMYAFHRAAAECCAHEKIHTAGFLCAAAVDYISSAMRLTPT